ncbi:MAG: DegT/DnrJ/EryC1/StrS family aminotransferase [Paludibacteraceae bacterium]|nr:DegT/DnrJ/EryC1/StrS family aminotransferase [Paludibacteraceae bacterium]
MEQIPMVDLKSQYLKIKDEVDAAIQEVLDSTAFVRGEAVSRFQHHFEEYLGVKHVIPVGNGTDALQIALMSLGLQPGDEVITPTFTFIATVEVVALLGLTPVFVDVDPYTFCMTPEAVEKAITPRTKAIVPVHLFGQNAEMETILKIAEKHHIFVVEDACQSVGSEFKFSDGIVKKSGCMGHFGCTSFFPSKNLGCFGDGGALFTDDDDLADAARCIANHGMKVRYHHDRVGVNSRLDTLQAAILDVKLSHLGEYIASRQASASMYDELLSDIPQVFIPRQTSWSTHSYHQYTIQVPAGKRDSLQIFLRENGIPSMIYYPIPLHLQKAYGNYGYKEGDFPVAERLSKEVLSLPMHSELQRDVLTVIARKIHEFFV